MAKFGIAHWTDFVRGVPGPRRKEMRAALEHSERARHTVKLLGQVVEIGRKDAAQGIPGQALRIVKAIASLQRRAPERTRLFSLPFSIRYDSSIHPGLMGARRARNAESHRLSQRQLAITAGDVSVDLRLDPEPGGVTVVGQVVTQGEEIRPMLQVPILLLSRGEVVGRASTGLFGEFLAEGMPRGPMNLCILIDDERYIDVPLFEETGADR